MEAARRAAGVVQQSPPDTRWLLACDTDADGLCAGAVAALALRKAGRRFTVRASRDKSEAGYRALFAESPGGVILLDKGTSHVGLLEDLAKAASIPIVVVDHHNLVGPEPRPDSLVTLLNPRAAGLDGSRDASASTTACAFALALCGDEAVAWAPIGLAGAHGDRQAEGGWQGWNLELAQRARRSGHLATMQLPRLHGDLARAIARLDPPIPGLHGDEAASAAFLDAIGADRHADVEDLPAEARTSLVSGLLLRLLARGAAPEDPAILMQDVDRHAALGASLRQVARVADACGRDGQPATGVAYLMGDKSARADAMACLLRHQARLRTALEELRARPPAAREAVSVVWTAEAADTGLVASRAVEDGLAAPDRPVCVLARRPDGQVQVSTRGTHALVARGLDLGRACAAAAQACGSEGGGHPVAAGAVVAAAAAEAFVAALDHALLGQGFLARP